MKVREAVILALILLLMVSLILATGCLTKGVTETEVSKLEDVRVRVVPLSSVLADIPRVLPEEVKTKLNAGEQVTIVDVRQRSSFDKLHIMGALSIPIAELTNRLQELPRQGMIVTY